MPLTKALVQKIHTKDTVVLPSVSIEGVLGVQGTLNLDGYVTSANNIIFNINGVDRVRIDGSGRVGIGKVPSYTLDVNGIINATSLSINGTPLILTGFATTGKAIAMAMVFGG